MLLRQLGSSSPGEFCAPVVCGADRPSQGVALTNGTCEHFWRKRSAAHSRRPLAFSKRGRPAAGGCGRPSGLVRPPDAICSSASRGFPHGQRGRARGHAGQRVAQGQRRAALARGAASARRGGQLRGAGQRGAWFSTRRVPRALSAPTGLVRRPASRAPCTDP
ncbi:hypothetical protein PsYK624_131710 [Phanerochaete sordida]|uniref:Uncharacterized protein n=1 Tax=Phanerochaete sordida TaxID=48140 RepID=A0A9P3GLI3_9APHY|nr:hypothetical protein PsYK624_131710 [Phanerochaete sordida]